MNRELVGAKEQDWQNRHHFFAVAAGAMRRYLIDQARARPKAELVPFDDLAETLPAGSTRLELAVDALLEGALRPLAPGFDLLLVVADPRRGYCQGFHVCTAGLASTRLPPLLSSIRGLVDPRQPESSSIHSKRCSGVDF